MSEHLPKSRAHPPLSLTLLPCGAVERENDLASALSERGMLVTVAKEQLDLGAVLVGAFDDAKVKRVLSLSQQEVPLYLIPVGKP